MVRDRRRGAAAREAAAAAFGLRRAGRRLRAGHDRRRQHPAFAELGFAPHVAGHVGQRELATTVMGQEMSLPVIISPTGVQAVAPRRRGGGGQGRGGARGPRWA